MFEKFPTFTPHTGTPLLPRCWACRDSGWVVSYPNEYQTVWTLCACHVVTIEPIVVSQTSLTARAA